MHLCPLDICIKCILCPEDIFDNNIRKCVYNILDNKIYSYMPNTYTQIVNEAFRNIVCICDSRI